LLSGVDGNSHVMTFSDSPVHSQPDDIDVDVDNAGGCMTPVSVDEYSQHLFSTSGNDDDGSRDDDSRAGSGGLFSAFAVNDDVGSPSPHNSFFFCPGDFETSVADTSAVSDGAGFQFLFGADANRSTTSDDDRTFTLF